MGTWDLETGFKSEPEYENVSVKRFFRVRKGVGNEDDGSCDNEDDRSCDKTFS